MLRITSDAGLDKEELGRGKGEESGDLRSSLLSLGKSSSLLPLKLSHRQKVSPLLCAILTQCVSGGCMMR